MHKRVVLHVRVQLEYEPVVCILNKMQNGNPEKYTYSLGQNTRYMIRVCRSDCAGENFMLAIVYYGAKLCKIK